MTVENERFKYKMKGFGGGDVSSISQAGTARMVLSAYGPAAIEKGVAEIWTP